MNSLTPLPHSLQNHHRLSHMHTELSYIAIPNPHTPMDIQPFFQLSPTLSPAHGPENPYNPETELGHRFVDYRNNGETQASLVVTTCEIEATHGCLDIHYYTQESTTEEFMDLTCVQCLVARVRDEGRRWAILDRSGSLSRPDFVDV